MSNQSESQSTAEINKLAFEAEVGRNAVIKGFTLVVISSSVEVRKKTKANVFRNVANALLPIHGSQAIRKPSTPSRPS